MAQLIRSIDVKRKKWLLDHRAGMTTGHADNYERRWMERALLLAQRAEAEGEVPVVVVLVRDG